MASQDKFKLSIINGEETIVKLFKTRQEICEFLDIKTSTLYALQRGTLGCKHNKQKILENIKIEKIPVSHSHNKYQTKKIPHNADTKEDYINTLLLKC